MCGRYGIFMDDETSEIADILSAVNQKYDNAKVKIGEIFPTNLAPVLLAQKDTLSPELFKWGFPNFKSKGILINACAETALQKKTFQDSVYTSRLVIPSTGFYEWKHDTGKQKYLFRLPNTPVLYMAGLYREYEGQMCYVILTANANSSIADIHNRMPLVLEKEKLKDWVFDTDAALNLLHEVPPQLIKQPITNNSIFNQICI